MSGTNFEPAWEVKQMAARIIEKHHPHLEDALDCIGFYFRDGSTEWSGKCSKATAFERHMTGKMLFIFINTADWKRLMPDQKLALVDHELTHIGRESTVTIDPVTKDMKNGWADSADPDNWHIKDHDVEEFADIIRRHGLWDTKREKFGEAVRLAPHQMTLADAFRNEEEETIIEEGERSSDPEVRKAAAMAREVFEARKIGQEMIDSSIRRVK